MKLKNNGNPVFVENIKIKNSQPFSKEIDLRENDVFLIKIIKQ